MQHIGVYGAARGLGSTLLGTNCRSVGGRHVHRWGTLHLQVLGTDEATEKLRRLWKRFCEGEVSERTWERAWDRYFRVRLAVRDANRAAGKD